MAWARRASATATGSANTGSTLNVGTLGATPTLNDRIIAVVGISATTAAGQPTINSISDDGGHTWTRDLLDQHNNTGFFAGLEVWSAVANGSAVANLTFHFNFSLTGVGGCAVAVGAYSGLSIATGAAAAVDISKVSQGLAANTPGDSGTTSSTTSAANELKIGAYVDPGNDNALSAGTLDTTYSVFAKKDLDPAEQAVLEDADSGASGSTARATVTWASASVDWQMAVVVYKLAASLVVDSPRGDRRPFPFTPGSPQQRM